MTSSSEHPSADQSGSVVVYWRPGCPWCSRLLRWIDRSGLEVQRRNIWEDPAAAAEVRAITGGHETVPTVSVAGVDLVNPSPKVLAATVRERLPALLPPEDPDDEPWWRRVARGS